MLTGSIRNIWSLENAKEQGNVLNEIKVFMEKISDAEANRKKFIKMNESLDNDFVSCVKKVEFEKKHDSGFWFQSKQIEATK